MSSEMARARMTERLSPKLKKKWKSFLNKRAWRLLTEDERKEVARAEHFAGRSPLSYAGQDWAQVPIHSVEFTDVERVAAFALLDLIQS